MRLNPFDLHVLISPALVIFFTTLIVSLKVTRNPLASTLAAVIKAGVFLVYFGLLFDGTFTFVDDWDYMDGAETLFNMGLDLRDIEGYWAQLLILGEGDHFLYFIVNAFAFKLFGIGYYAPVALNIIFTVLLAGLACRIPVNEFSWPSSWKSKFYFFLLLHPDIMAWSNIMNGKDLLVLLLHGILLAGMCQYFKGRIKSALVIIVSSSVVLFFLRFYVPILFSLAFMFTLFSREFIKRQKGMIFVGIGLLAAVGVVFGSSNLLVYAINALAEKFVNPVYGVFRFMLSPIPFNTEVQYGFLDVPSVLHWIMVPAVFWGLIQVWRQKSPFAKFFLAYFLLFMALYSVYSELQGPRHRVQLDLAFAILQFWALAHWFKFVARVECSNQSLSGAFEV